MSTPIDFTRQDLNVVANRALAAVGTDARWCAAINRAVLHLATGRFSYDGHQVVLHSASGEGTYHIDTTEPMTCSCKGRARGYICWHICAARLIVRAAEYHAGMARVQVVTCTHRAMVDVQAAADALFN